MRATFGRTPEVAQDGPEDKNLGFVSAPLVSLTKNEIVHVAVFDRDVFELTSLARVNVAYAGTPIVVAASAIAAVDEQKARVFDELRDGAVDETSRRRARIS